MSFDVRTLDAYGWGFDLISSDESVRQAALHRHRTLLWRIYRDSPTGTIVDPVDSYPYSPALEPYGVLFLQWEARFPDSWRDSWLRSPWSTKEAVLGRFRHTDDLQPATRAALEELLIGAVQRVQRCGDCEYWLLARHLDGPALRARLEAIDSLRARYVLWVLDHPDEPVTARAFRRWRRTVGVAGLTPWSGPELAAQPAEEAAAALAELTDRELAAVFEVLEPGPAGRIALRLDLDVVAQAVGRMDPRTATRMLRGMPAEVAAALLVAMPAEVAATRFPAGRRGLLRRMTPEAAHARLVAMSPAAAAEQLENFPPAEAAAALTALDPDRAGQVLHGFMFHADAVLAVMPDEVAGPILANAPRYLAFGREYERFRLAVQELGS